MQHRSCIDGFDVVQFFGQVQFLGAWFACQGEGGQIQLALLGAPQTVVARLSCWMSADIDPVLLTGMLSQGQSHIVNASRIPPWPLGG